MERRARLRQSSISLGSGTSQLPQPFLLPSAHAEATRAQTTFPPAAGRALTTAVTCNIRHNVAGLGFRKGYTTLPRRLRQVLAHGGGARLLVQTWYLRLVVRCWPRGMAQFHVLVDTTAGCGSDVQWETRSVQNVEAQTPLLQFCHLSTSLVQHGSKRRTGGTNDRC